MGDSVPIGETGRTSGAVVATSEHKGGRKAALTTAPALRTLAIRLLEHVGDLAAESVGQLQSAELAYLSLVPEADLLGTVTSTFRLILRALAMEPVGAEMSTVAASIGRRRAEQGVPLEAVLHSFRIDFRVLWQAVQHEGEGLEVASLGVVLSAVMRLWGVVDAMSVDVSAAYRQVESDAAEARALQRRSLLVALLFGPGPADPIVRTLSSECLLSAEGTFVVVIGETRLPGRDCFEQPERELDRAGFRSVWCLEACGQVGVVELRPERLTELRAVLRRTARGRSGVSPSFTSLRRARDHVWLASCGLSTIREDDVGVASVLDEPVRTAVAAAPEVSLHLARAILGPLGALNDRRRRRLVETLRLYLQTGSVAEVAATLHYHRNTVLNRLEQVESALGISLRSPRDTAAVVLAPEAAGLLENEEDR